MNLWMLFWSIFFFVSLAVFVGLAVTVTIGGFFNIRSLLKGLSEDSEKTDSQ